MILSEFMNPLQDVRDTLRHLSDLDLIKATKSYVKSIPGVTLIGLTGKKLVGTTFIKGASTLAKMGLIDKSAVLSVGKFGVQTGKLISGLATKWVGPANTFVAASVRTGVSSAPKIGAAALKALPVLGKAAAVLAIDSGFSKITKQPSLIDIGYYTFTGKGNRDKLFNVNNVYDALAGPKVIANTVKTARQVLGFKDSNDNKEVK